MTGARGGGRGSPHAAALRGVLLLAGAGTAAYLRSPAFVAPTSNPQGWLSSSVRGVGCVTAPVTAPVTTSRRQAAATAEGASTFGYAARVVLGAACAFVASMSSQRAKQQRNTNVLMRMHPSACGRPKQKVLRRIEVYGSIPAWSRRPLVNKRLKQPWRKRVTPKLSQWGREQMEKTRIRYHYNIKLRQLEGYMVKAFKKGIEYPVDNLMQRLESRIDNVLWRVGLAPTMAGARHFIREGHLQWQTGERRWITINIPSLLLKPGDKFRVRKKGRSQRYGKRNLDDEGPVDVPQHLRFDRDTMEGEYLDLCDVNDLGIHVDDRLVVRSACGTYGLRRTHERYFEGSGKIIPKRVPGGRIRPTPENILNMKKGLGLRRRGRFRPPSLWGRKMPLNDPYEISRKIM